jgi:hypothetical protein
MVGSLRTLYEKLASLAEPAKPLTLFLLKGGSYLQYRLGLSTRATKDVDGLTRGELDTFLMQLDDVLTHPWGAPTFQRSDLEVIDTPGKLMKPGRFDLKVMVRSDVWRNVKIEISSDEADIGSENELLPAPKLHAFALPDPDQLFGVTLRGQISQKLHAITDPHQPPEYRNDRARDLVDLVILRRTAEAEAAPTAAQLREMAVKVFDERAAGARARRPLNKARFRAPERSGHFRDALYSPWSV